MMKKTFKVSWLVIAIAMSNHAMADTLKERDESLPVIEVTAVEENRYQQGKQEQFTNNIVTLYKDKEEVERYKGVNPADILSGIPGVYSSDARNNGSISPNIRGLQGEGRTPVVVDGTRSEYTVYRGYAGVNNRTYVDPNLISEVKAYKGATELTHGMPQAVGGAVMLNTINAKDVITDDKNWGINVKYETNNNSVAPRYPTINYGERVDTPENHWVLFGDVNPQLYIPLKNSGKNKFFQDYAFRLAVAGKTDLTDVMLAYSKREQGNYFSGKKKADLYSERFTGENKNEIQFADFALPGYETPNTSSKNESWLFKNNWYLPKGQEINLSWRKSDLEYGEIMNSRSVYSHIVKTAFDYGPNSNIGVQWTPAKIEQHAGSIDYKFNPKNDKWLNLKAGLWYNNTHSRNNSSGGPIAYVTAIDGDLDYELMQMLLNSSCVQSNGLGLHEVERFNVSCNITKEDIEKAFQAYKDYKGFDFPNADKNLKIINPALHIVRNKQFGFDISNQMQLLPNLSLTIGANLRKEQQKGKQGTLPRYCFGQGFDANGQCQGNFIVNQYIFPPKSGERNEYSSWFNFNWQATDKLNINLGGRWGGYNLEDKDTDDRIRNKELSRKKVLGGIEYTVWQHRSEEETRYLYDNQILCNYPYRNYCEDASGSTSLARDKYFEFLEQKGYVHLVGLPFDVFQLKQRLLWEADEKGKLHADNAPFAQLKANQSLQSGQAYSKKNAEAGKYEPIGKQKAHSFDPSFSISYQFTPYTRAYARYAQVTRFPSLYEGTSGFSDLYQKVVEARNFEPEQARNIEVGVVQDMTQWFPQLKMADIKLNYYHNTLHHVIDRSDYSNANFFAQYDQLKTRGLELQARFDYGRIFADAGYNYLIKSQMCDRDHAYATYFDKYYPSYGGEYDIHNVPTCFTGGFPGGYLRGAIPPKHSLTLNLGSRWLDEHLTLGSRISYQSAANNKKQRQENWAQAEGLNGYPWRSYMTIDAYADYKPTANLTLSLIGTNLTNVYYPDALTRTVIAAPGRTFKLGIDYKF